MCERRSNTSISDFPTLYIAGFKSSCDISRAINQFFCLFSALNGTHCSSATSQNSTEITKTFPNRLRSDWQLRDSLRRRNQNKTSTSDMQTEAGRIFFIRFADSPEVKQRKHYDLSAFSIGPFGYRATLCQPLQLPDYNLRLTFE